LCFSGRLHCLLRGTLLEPLLSDVQRCWMKLIYGYLPTEQTFSQNAVSKFKNKNYKITDLVENDGDPVDPKQKRSTRNPKP